MNVNDQHEHLVSLLGGIADCDATERQLWKQLEENQRLRSLYDDAVYRIMAGAEKEPLTPAGFRKLLDGVHGQVSVSLARRSLRETN